MKFLPYISPLTFLALAGLASACASTETAFDDHSATGGTGSTNGGAGSGSSRAKGGSTSSLLGNGGNVQINSNDACGAADVEAELTPVYMVFIYDKSASMGRNEFTDTSGVVTVVDNTELRWKPVKEGVINFFQNSKAANVQASIAFFAAPGDKATTCAHDYAVPNVAMTPLETPQKLIDALNKEVPTGGTPTLPAVIGGVKYAKKLLADNPGSEAMVVLVTDGEPAIYANGVVETDCAPAGFTNMSNTIGDIAKYVSGAKATVKTHVIGIGSVASLEEIATAAGTEFIQIDPTDPAVTKTKILSELTKIQPKKISCNIKLPTTADGFDKKLVNVNFEHSNGKPKEEFSKSDEQCGKPGWRFDSADNPKYIELCPTTCTAIQGDLDGKVKILLGCPTRDIL